MRSPDAYLLDGFYEEGHHVDALILAYRLTMASYATLQVFYLSRLLAAFAQPRQRKWTLTEVF